MPTRLVDMEKKVPTSETEKGRLAKSNAELLLSATRKEPKNARMKAYITETIPLMCLGFALYVQKAIVQSCCKEVLGLLPFSLELRGSCRRRCETV